MAIPDFPWYSGLSAEQLEKRLRDIERSKREFFAEARDGFYISTREGNFLDCNHALVRMLGYESVAEVLSLDLNKELWLNPEDRPRFQAIIEKDGFVSDYKGGFKHKSGRVVYVSLSSHVWRDEDGNIRGYRGVVVDRTAEKMMRDRLAALETRYRDLFDNMQDGVFICDRSGTVADCNQAFCDMVGYSREELLALEYYRDLFVDTDDVVTFRKRLSELGRVSNCELQIVRKDGKVRDVSMSGYIGRDADGRVISYQGMVRDITDEKRLRNQLIQSEKLSAMGRMASQLAHELNNPIYGIMNCVELAKEAIPEGHSKRRFLELAYNECRRTSGMLLKMLKFCKPDQDEKKPTQINKLLEETLLFYERQFKNLNIRVTFDPAEDLPLVVAVAGQLKQVFINMIINANAAMPSGGELTVTSELNADDIVVRIRDTGVGIPRDHLEKIFEAFFTTKTDVKGVGLGLSICYELIKNHGGSITVESEVGKGTAFSIHLPRGHMRIAEEEAEEAAAASGL
ncbi:MAG: PAS domain S-box protein [Desulfomonile tiedjei]|nr:PAS domain S-box protein [Desulfomonile tiedjei]